MLKRLIVRVLFGSVQKRIAQLRRSVDTLEADIRRAEARKFRR